MKVAFLIGVNDVGGAEYVSAQHVIMAHKSGLDVVVLSETSGMFFKMIESAGVNIKLTGNAIRISVLESLLTDCDVVFNCNSFGITASVTSLKRKLGFRYVTIIHSNIDWVFQTLTKYDAFTDGYYAIHQKIVDTFVAKGINPEKLTRIPNCVDANLVKKDLVKRQLLREKYRFKDGDFVIGMITRISQDKNIIDAVKILSKLPDAISAKLFIIGGAANNHSSSHYNEFLNNEINRLKLTERVIISGNVTSAEVYELMQAFDLGLNCSPSEGLPIALLEMMGAGIPCIMPAFGEIPEVIGAARGITIPIRQRIIFTEILAYPCYTDHEIEQFVSGISHLFQEKELRYKLGKNAAAYIAEFRDLEVQKKLLIEFLQKNVRKKGETDVVYVLGTGSSWDNNEIRFSIRSFVKYFEDLRNVVIVGDCPSFIQGVIHIQCNDIKGINKDARMAIKIKAACNDARVSNNFVLCTDDTLLLAPVAAADFCGWHDGPIKYDAFKDQAEHKKAINSAAPVSDWYSFVYNTGRELKKRNLPDNNYDRAHAPQPVNKAEFLEIIKQWEIEQTHYTISNIYNNSSKIFTGKQTGLNAKIYRTCDITGIIRLTAGKQCLNYNDEALNTALRQWLYQTFPEATRYESFTTEATRRESVEKWFQNGSNYAEGVEVFKHHAPKNRHLIRYFEVKHNNEMADKKLKKTLELWLR